MDAAARKAMAAMSLMVLEDGARWASTAVDFQREHAAAILDTSEPVRQTWIEAPRGSRKTTDCAGLLLAVLYAQAPAGARLYVGASDEDQAAELVDAARGLIDRTPELAGEFIVTELTITSARTGASVTALPADASAFGKRAYMIVLDEVSNWPETRKARRFWSTLMSGNRKLRDCRTVVLSNSGDPSHWAWKRRETARTSRHWQFFQVEGPLPWLTPDDLSALAENLTPSEFAQLHLGQWTASEDRLADRADVDACTVLPGPQPPRGGVRYVISADLGSVNDRAVVAVQHAEDSTGGRRAVLDRLERWQGSRAAPVDLAAVRDTILALSREYNRAEVVIDPWQAKLLAAELREAGVMVNEFNFTATSVGRLALSLHSAIRQHRISLFPDEDLADELVSVRLVKNAVGTYRLDHDSGAHDDQAVTLALGCFWLLDADPEPEFTIFGDQPGGWLEDAGVELLTPAGQFAIRIGDDDPWAAIERTRDDDLQRHIVRTLTGKLSSGNGRAAADPGLVR